MVKQTDFEMFSPAGNYACRRLASSIVRNAHKLDTPEKLDKFFQEGIDKIEKKHGEVWDTEPRNHLLRYCDKVAELHGYERIWP